MDDVRLDDLDPPPPASMGPVPAGTPSEPVFEVLRQGEELVLYRRREPGAPSRLALGVASQQPQRHALERLAHEYALAAELDSAWAAKPLALTRHDGRRILLLEDPGGEPLDQILERARESGKPFNLTRILQIAADLASSLAHVHERRLIHKDVKPSNVLVDDAGRTHLMGFGIASRLLRERQAPAALIAGTLAYMAPEQTGRMNRSVDARSDLYAFGVTLYEMLTGRLPFAASDPREWIHCHIARTPLPPSEWRHALPGMLDRIVLKLLAKNAEDRYQTAKGVETDLRRCLAEWVAHGRIAPFPLGEHDMLGRLLMPERLYGREGDIGVLLAAFDRVVRHGSIELVVISGYAGIGKSSVVNELHKALVPPRGLFAAGKFDQYKRDIPYATLAEALQGLVRQLLTKDETELARWREEIMAAVGPNGQLMVTLIPELALVIGEQPPIPHVEPQEAQARFQSVFKKLLRVFAQPEHPLALFVDDLQWLDSGTLDLLYGLATDPESRHLLLVGAYRANEVDAAHPLAKTLAAIRTAGGAISEIVLAPLQTAHVAQLVADTLHADVARVRPLAELAQKKTGGNPFFVIQFISALEDEGLLTFDADRAAWRWDVRSIRAKGITDNVAELMATRLGRLTDRVRDVLGPLACIGNRVASGTLALVVGDTVPRLHGVLRDAVNAGLVVYVDDRVAFSHDRVHEAAYAMIPASDRVAMHLRIGRALVKQLAPSEREEQIFEIVSQFDRGAAAIRTTPERDRVAELYLAAGKRAMTASAYASAQGYLAAGRALLGDDAWARQYRLTFELERHRAECEFVTGALGSAEGRLEAISARAATLTDEADIVCLAMLLYFTTGRSGLAVDVGLAYLRRAGIAWVAHPDVAEVQREYRRLRRNLARRPLPSLIELPAMTDPDTIAVMDVLTGVFPAAHSVDRCLLELVLLRMANLSIEHGNCDSSSVAYSALNMVLGPRFADYGTAYDLGRLACELVERRGMKRYEARVYSCVGSFAMPWTKPLPECRPMLRRAFAVGTSIGDRAFAAYTFRHLVTQLLASGTPLADVQREAELALAFAREAGVGLAAERFVGQLGLVHALRGTAGPEWPDDDWARADVAHLPGLAMIVGFHWVFRLQERYLAGDIPGALDAAARVAPIRWAMRSCFEEAEYEFYAALARAEACDGAPPDQRAAHLRALREHLARIRAWRANCPETFAHREALVRAELMRLRGRELETERSYEEAIRLAHEHGFIQNAAIANERAARFYEARGFTTTADAHLRGARQCFAQWGAVATLRRFDARHPQLRAQPDGSPQLSTIDAPVAQLDAETVVRASQALSGEMELPALIEKLMRLAMEHAGAERGVLILLQGDEPHVEAEASTRAGALQVKVRRARVTPADVPLAVLQYTLRTRDRVVHDAAGPGDVGEEYLRRRRPRSVLCLPILKQAKVVGALYLENSLTAGVFTPDRLAALDYIAAQAAISIENARLYSDLRRSEAMLSEAQRLSATGSFLWRVATNEITWSEQNHRIFDVDPSVPVTLELIGSRMHEDDRAVLADMVERGRADDGDLDYEFRLRVPDGTVKHVHLRAHATRDKDGTLEYVGAIQDVSHQRRSDDAITKLRSELTHVARVTSLGVLTASIAHEVNQPLAGIMTNAGTCLRMLAAEPPNVQGAVETVRRTIRDGERASAVIARLRALFAKEGAMTEQVDLNEAAREVIALSLAELQTSGVQLRAELQPDLPPIWGDRVQLQQVLLNLILNARDAMSDVDGRPPLLLIRTDEDETGAVRVSVRDSGVGLDAPTREKLFEAFYTTKRNGMGIGLSVSRSIIERHRGRLWAAQNDGPGATFSFAIPCTPDTAADAGAARADAGPARTSAAPPTPMAAGGTAPQEVRLS